METLLTNNTGQSVASTISKPTPTLLKALDKETYIDDKEKEGFLQEVYLLIADGRIPEGFLPIPDLLRLYRALSSKRICGSQMAARVFNLLEHLSFIPTCASLWKVIFKRLSIDELPTLVFLLQKAHTAELYQFVGHSYLFKMTKEEMLCLTALIELSEVYAAVKIKGKYTTPATKEEQAVLKQDTTIEQWDYTFSLS